MSRRTLHVVRSLRAETGGVAEAVLNLVQALRDRGDEAKIASLDPADAERGDVTVVGRESLGYGYAPGYVPWLREAGAGVDAVVVHGLWQYPGFAAWRALRRRTPYMVFCHGMLDPWFKRTYPLKHLKKWLYWPWAEYRVLRDAAAVCFTCEEERRRARESFWLYRAREEIAPLGIPAPVGDAVRETSAFRAAFPELRGRRMLLFLGRVHPKKGIDLLLGAMKRQAAQWPRDLCVAIAGPTADEAYRTRLQASGRTDGLDDRLVWLPMLQGELKWGALRACEAFVLPSHQENFGMAVVEALACGRPVLISDQVNIWREIVGEGAGMAESDTVAGTHALLARWLGLEEAGRAAMAEAAGRCFAARFACAAAAERFDAVLGRVLAGR